MPKATYRSGCRDKHNRGGRDEQILYTHHGNQENCFSANDVIPYILHKPEWQTIFKAQFHRLLTEKMTFVFMRVRQERGRPLAEVRLRLRYLWEPLYIG